ncbi:MAG: nucleotidyltransferase domain-containing protein [Elusimicrobiota bacterium]
MVKILDENLQFFLNELKKNFGTKVKKIILFGSRARNEYVDESDYDFIFIFDKVTPEIKNRLKRLTIEMLIEHGMVITDFAFTEKDLERKKYEPFIMNAAREGIVL